MKICTRKLFSVIFIFLRNWSSMIMLLLYFSVKAQPPQWQWAKGVGGSHQDGILGYNASTFNGGMHVDTMGNIYEVIVGQSSSYTFGSFHFTNAGGSGANVAYFVKYSPQGTVLWVREFPRYPASAGGGAVIPFSMFTKPTGHSFLLFGFRDSLRLGSIILVDTSIHISATSNNGYCIAEYDENGNVISLNAHQARHTSISAIYQLKDRILALGFCPGIYLDTLDGQPVDKGYFLAVMDSAGQVLKAKTLGYDSTSGGFLPAQAIAIGNNSIYIQPSFSRPFVYQSAMPIGSLNQYINGSTLHFLAKFDTELNFQWFKSLNNTLSFPMCADKDGNVYLTGSGSSNPIPDTLIFDTTHVVLPYLPPIHTYAYHTVAKINSMGVLQWASLLIEPGTSPTQSICTDQLDNVYMAGTYGPYLIAGTDTLSDPANIFIVKLSRSTGEVVWAESTRLGGRLNSYGIAEDGYGNIYMNGDFADPHFPVAFGHDTLICTAPIANYPLAGDVFTARLGNCAATKPAVTASGALSWCGIDSVSLSTAIAHSYLWSSGDTTSTIKVKNTGVYYVYSIDSMGCYAISANTIVKANPNPAISATVNKQVSCFGGNDGSISIQADNGTPPYQYTSSPPIMDYTQASAGSYHITVTDTAGCVAYDSVTLIQPATMLSIYTDPLPTTSIAGNGQAIVVATGATAPYTFLWNTTPAQNNDTAVNLKQGWYTVTVTDSKGCTLVDSVYIPLYNGIGDKAPNNIRVYPNPVTDKFYIETSNGITIKIYDMLGAKILQQYIGTGINKIDTNTWPSGNYRIVIDDGGVSYSNKMIVYH